MHEHMSMMFPHMREGSKAEEATESKSFEAREDAGAGGTVSNY